MSLTDPPPDAARVRRGMREHGHVAGARRRRGRDRHAAVLADHPRGPPADRAREPGRPLRRRRDRPDARPQHPQPDRRGEGRDARVGSARARRSSTAPRRSRRRSSCACTARSGTGRCCGERRSELLGGARAPRPGHRRGRRRRAARRAAACGSGPARAATCSTWRSPAAPRSIEGIEQDMEGNLQLAVAIDDDPGRDLGMRRQPGHRFFFSPDEVEPLTADDGTAAVAGRADPRRRDRQRLPRRRRLRRRARRPPRPARAARRGRGRRLRHPRHGPRLRARTTAGTPCCCSTPCRAASRPGRCP